MPVTDALHRPLQDLRVSVTDRCNLRCSYCMPEDRYQWIEREEILRFEEIARVVRVFVDLGVRKVRLTGGEPLLRAHLPRLVGQLRAVDGLDEICLTTNALRLTESAEPLRAAGLNRINVSLDTLSAERFTQLTRRDGLERALRGIDAAAARGFRGTKLNMVVQRGVNDDEIVDMAAFCRERGLRLRLIEFMDVGTRNRWNLEAVVPRAEMLARIQERFPLAASSRDRLSDPASVHRWADGAPGDLGVIASVTEPFCGACSRARLTADGRLVTCLFARDGVDLKAPLRDGSDDRALGERVRQVWTARADRFSEERNDRIRRGEQVGGDEKMEMITLGG